MYPKFGIYALLFWPFHCGKAALAAEWYNTSIGIEVIRVLTPEVLTAADIPQKTGQPLPANPMSRQIWMSEAKNNGSTRDAKLGLTMIHDGQQLLPDDFLMACYLNWDWLLNDLRPGVISKYDQVRNTRGQSGLHLAIKQGNIGIVRFLLERGADPDTHASDLESSTPLGMATLSNQPDMVRLLLRIDVPEFESDPLSFEDRKRIRRSRADVNADAYGWNNTALHLAGLYNLPEIAKILCRAEDINLNLRNAKGATALLDSAAVGSKDVARILIDRDDIDLTEMARDLNRESLTELSALHATKSPGIARILLDKDLELANLENPPVLSHWLPRRKPTGPFADATYEHNLPARLDVLLSYVDISSALESPACMQGVPILKRSVNRTQIMLPVTSSLPEIWQDTSGDTLLHKAAARGSVEVLKLLLRCGADATLLNNAGETALNLAQRHSRDDVAAVLEQKIAETTENSS